jgi:hypothetical protein
MARPKLQKTLADYLAIGATPLLIMLLVGSLVFFLQSLFYDGRHGTRVLWILFWFVIGAVLVARISIESGRAYAGMFTLALAGATSLAMFRFADAPLVPIICLGIIWWATDKLTWDCSLIDDSEDASGEGLLQVAGVADEAELTDASAQTSPASKAEKASPDSASHSNAHEKVPVWKRLFLNESERKGKPHAPGLWVVYFSLAALPLFGFGQVMLPAGDETRRFAFLCLFVYVASGLGLLMLTSFLGLRRYLRQRNMQMPTSMALTWVAMGSAIAVGILIACLVLPRPEGEYDVTAMIDRASEEVQEASDWAFGDSSGEGDGERSGEADENATEGAASDPNKKGKPGGKEGEQTAQSENAKDGEDGAQKGGEKSGEQSGEGEKQANNSKSGEESGKPPENGGEQQNQKPGENVAQNEDKKQNENKEKQEPGEAGQPPESDQDGEKVAQNSGDGEPPKDGESKSEADSSPPETPESPDLSSALSKVGDLFKWIVYGIIAAVAIFLIIRNWAAISSFLLNLWNELLSMFGRRPAATAEESVAADESVAPPRPFSAFSNPFQTGAARKKSPSELVWYTFEALQAWATENNCPREPNQTPIEFGQQLRAYKVPCAVEGQEVSQLYAQVAYASHRPGAESLPVLEKLWRKMSV